SARTNTTESTPSPALRMRSRPANHRRLVRAPARLPRINRLPRNPRKETTMTTHSPAPEQGSPEWLAQRAGKLTASTFGDAIAVAKSGKNKGQSTAARERLMLVKAFERTAGIPKSSIDSYSLRWGKDLEPYAREAYEIETGNVVNQVGLIVHPTYDYI